MHVYEHSLVSLIVKNEVIIAALRKT